MGFENLPSYAAALDDLRARIEALGTSAGAADLRAQLKALETLANAATAAIEAIPPIPKAGEPYRLGEPVEPSSIPTLRPSDRFQGDLSAAPPGFQRSPTGGIMPGTSQPSLWNAGAEGAVNPGIYIPPDYSEGARQRREQRAGAWNEAAAADAIRQLRELLVRLTEVFGGPTYISGIIEQEIRNIEARVLTPDEALAFIRYILSTMYAGLQQEAMSPVASIRSVASDLMRFAGGAALPGGPGALTPGPRPVPPAETGRDTFAGRETFAGVGASASVRGAVREEVAGLHATFTRVTERQTERVLAGISFTPAAVQKKLEPDLRRLRDDVRSEGERGRVAFGRSLSDEFERALATRRLG